MSNLKKPLSIEILKRCRTLRRDSTDAEGLVWFLLRNRRLGGFKFRRQHPVGPYILDFYCQETKLAIELDGGQHNSPEEMIYDQERTCYLSALGIRVLRFWNNEVLNNPEGVLQVIWNLLHEHSGQ